MIGESSGNGHPFSWQAIFNGYNPQTIENCGFPVIYDYLAKESWDKDHIPNFKITKVWTNNPSRTEFIASTSSLCKPCQNFEDLFDEIDAFIVARDDYYPNELILNRVLQQGKPILFDKQISYSLKSTKSMIDLANSYKVPIISGSAIGFDENLNLQELIIIRAFIL